MNTPEFRLLAIWQGVIEMKNVQRKMPAYQKIASQVGIDERNVRENIKKLVEQGFLVEKGKWYVTNFEHEFIQYVVTSHKEWQQRIADSGIRFHIGPPTRDCVHPTHFVEYTRETIQIFKNTFGEYYKDALDFYEVEVLKTI